MHRSWSIYPAQLIFKCYFNLETTMEFIRQYGPALGSIGAAIAFAWTVFQWLAVRSREARNREYQTFHELIKTLVTGNVGPGEKPFIDQQAAALFELRNYPRYFPFLQRTITGLGAGWGPEIHQRLREEIALTSANIEKHESRIDRKLRRQLLN